MGEHSWKWSHGRKGFLWDLEREWTGFSCLLPVRALWHLPNASDEPVGCPPCRRSSVNSASFIELDLAESPVLCWAVWCDTR